MPHSRDSLETGLATFGELVEAEYGLPFAHWMRAEPWTDLDRLRLARTLDGLVCAPIADIVAAAPEAVAASETGARNIEILSDAKIAGPDWESSWQWDLLAAIDNATKQASGGMITPADPRMFVLRIRYRSDFFTVLAAYLAETLCGRALRSGFDAEPATPGGAALPERAEDRAALLRQIPGLDKASPVFLAALVFVIARLGTKAFCAWCDDCG